MTRPSKPSRLLALFSSPVTIALVNTGGGVALSFALALAFAVSPAFSVLPSLPWGILLAVIAVLLLVFVNRLSSRARLIKEADAKQQLDVELQVRENSQFILSSLASAFENQGEAQPSSRIGVAWDPIMGLCRILFPVQVRAQVFVVDQDSDGRYFFTAMPHGMGIHRREVSSQRIFDEYSETWKRLRDGDIIYCADTADDEPYGCYMSRGIISKTGELYGFFAIDAVDPGSLDLERDRKSLAYLSTLLLLVMVADPSVTKSVPLFVPKRGGQLESEPPIETEEGEDTK